MKTKLVSKMHEFLTKNLFLNVMSYVWNALIVQVATIGTIPIGGWCDCYTDTGHVKPCYCALIMVASNH